MTDTIESLCFRIALCGTKYDTEDVVVLNALITKEYDLLDTFPKTSYAAFNTFYCDRLRKAGWQWEFTPDALCRLVSVTADECDQPLIVEVRR